VLPPLIAARVLIVDDDAGLLDLLSMVLSDAGFVVTTARDGGAGWRAFEAGAYDVVVLDLVMPELDGLELCRRIRRAGDTPIMMLTSKHDELDKVLGLELGADDYVTKPFSNRELVARLRALHRRASAALATSKAEPRARVDEHSDQRLEVRGLVLDRSSRDVTLGGQPVALTVSEFELLWAVARTPGRVLSRDELIDAVYGPDVVVTDRTIDTFVKRIRHKLRARVPDFDELETIRSVGYRYRP
jgi:two-component system response regulator ChvI